jgi:hypothetical protein
MSRKLLLSFAGVATTLAATACAAVAGPLNLGAAPQLNGNYAALVLVNMGGGGGFHGGGFGGFHGGGFGGVHGGGFGGIHGGFGGFHHGGFGGFHGHVMGGPHFASRDFGPRAHFSGHNFHFAHDFRHRHNRFFFVGYPYYDNYYYDDYYDSACWWSGRYRRWVCPDYDY